jgi:hypothetical protein
MSFAAYIAAACSAFWIDYGWTPLPGGGHEYILQVSSEDIDALRTESIESYVPLEVRDIRRIRITVGNERLPQETTPPQPPLNEAATKSNESPPSPSQAAESRTANYTANPAEEGPAQTSTSASDGTSTDNGWLSSIGIDPLVLAQVGLGVAAAAVIFLTWAHLGMRRRYRALLHRIHGQ